MNLRVVVVGLFLLGSGCAAFRESVVISAIREQADFIPDHAHYAGWELEKVADRVYSFRYEWSRSLVVDTDEGFVVQDVYGAKSTQLLKDALEKLAPGKPVHTLFYSHYHLDHVAGGAPLKPLHVVAHQKCPGYWAMVPDSPGVKDIVAPTQLVDGDQTFTIGGVEIRLVFLGKSHTDTLYAFYLPAQKVLQTADTALVRSTFPLGGPDMYTPGVLKGLQKLEALDFVHYLPSHFSRGTRADFDEAVMFARDVERLARESLATNAPGTADGYEAGFRYMYEPLKKKYGHFHGFDENIVFIVGRAFTGALLGF